jgi:hypothetical protein
MSEANNALSPKELERLYGGYFRRGSKSRINRDAVPRQLWPLIPYAGFWGIIDDWDRDELVDNAPADVQQNLAAVVALLNDDLNDWLGGPEAEISPPSPEYVAFSYMSMAADYAAVIIRNRKDNYRFLTAAAMKEVYGDFYQKSPRVHLNREAIPYGCLSLTHYAEFWGISDDRARVALVDQAPPEIRKNLKDVVSRFEGDLSEWRDGRDQEHPPNGPEYEAFSAMIKAADYA